MINLPVFLSLRVNANYVDSKDDFIVDQEEWASHQVGLATL
ncbi:hypothetical protein [Dolichospermum compactum]|nr:hypothetical protein [Dolichospermum compactum]